MADVHTTDEWIERIAEAVVQKLDERDQINAIAVQVLRLLEARTSSQSSPPEGEAGQEQVKT